MMTRQSLSPTLASVGRSAEGALASARASRVPSIDIVRGIAIISIVGADQLAWALRGLAGDGQSLLASWTRSVATQFEHAEWEGFRFYDLILPLLIFVTGVSIVFSLAKERSEEQPF